MVGVKGAQSDWLREAYAQEAAGEGPFESSVDFSFLNSTSCLGKKPGGGNWDYRESVVYRPSMWNQEGGE